MQLNKFQQECTKTDLFLGQALKFVDSHTTEQVAEVLAMLLAYVQLTEEVGEVGRHLNRLIRDEKPIDRDAFGKELFDVAWSNNALASHAELEMEDVAQTGLAKLRKRYELNMIQGEGDERENGG